MPLRIMERRRGRRGNPPCSRQRQEDIIFLARKIPEMQRHGRLESGSVVKLIMEFLNLSKSTVTKYYKKDISGLRTPGKKRRRRAYVIEKVDEFGKGIIRKIIYGMCEKGVHVTLDCLIEEVRRNEDVGFSGSKATLRRLLLQMGFSWEITDNRRALVERADIVAQRTEYLRQYKSLKDENCNFIFLDETWFFSKGYASRSWRDASSSSCVRKNLCEGERYIVLHAGGKKGFVTGAELVFPSQNSTEDYHGTMTGEMFENWMENTLLPKLEEKSVIVLDNASYHSAHLERLPTKKWTKAQLKTFLDSHNVLYRADALHRELFALASLHKPEKQYRVDNIIRAAGHKVLRLPPYHCHYNPIEMVWNDCKRYYKTHIGKQFDRPHVRKVWQDALQQVTAEKWKNYVQHTEKIVEKDWHREVKWDSMDVEPMIINVGEDSSSDEENEDDSEPLAFPLPGPSGEGC